MSEDLNFIEQTSQTIKELAEISTRLDERVKNNTKMQDELLEKIEQIQRDISGLKAKLEIVSQTNSIELINRLREEISNLKLEIKTLRTKSDNSEGRWKTIVNFFIQIGWVIMAAYILTKMGLQAPAVP